MNTSTISGLRVKTAIKAGGFNLNHSAGLRVKSAVKAGGFNLNHNSAFSGRLA